GTDPGNHRGAIAGGARRRRLRGRVRSGEAGAAAGVDRGRRSVHLHLPKADHRLRDRAAAAGALRYSRVRAGRGADVLWGEPRRPLSARCRLYRQDPQRRQARRPAGAAADQIRAGHQPPDREGARPATAGKAGRSRRRGDRMRRREFMTLGGAAAASSLSWPLAAHAQQPRQKLPTIGFLGSSTPAGWAPWVAAFQQRLRELGRIEGRTVAIEYRWAGGSNERGAEIAAEFARRKVDVIVTTGSSALAVKEAIATVPVVFALLADPIGSGYIANLARPGGNATGLSLQSLDTGAKRLELLREVVPGLRRLVILARLDNPSNVVERGEVEAAARTLGIELVTGNIRRAEDIVPAFDAFRGSADALHVVSDPLLVANGLRINTLALGARLPTIYSYREGV